MNISARNNKEYKSYLDLPTARDRIVWNAKCTVRNVIKMTSFGFPVAGYHIKSNIDNTRGVLNYNIVV